MFYPSIIEPNIENWLPWMPILNASLVINAISCAQNQKVSKESLIGFLISNIYSFEFVSNRLLNALNSCPIAKKRVGIIEDCIKAHKNGLYTLTLPVLLEQFDGMFVEYYNARFPNKHKINRFNTKAFSDYSMVTVNELYDSNYSGDVVIARDGENNGSGEKHCFKTEQLFKDYVKDTVFGKGKDNYSIWRNGILHGKTIDYGTEWNSLLCFLLLFDLCVIESMIREEK
jgi:hypothetical protein